MRFRLLVASAALLCLASPAVAQSVTYDFDKGTNFARYKTYAWVRGTPIADELNHKRIMDAVDTQMQTKGFTRVERSAAPDVLIAYHASFDKNLQINGFATGWGGYRFGGMRSGSATTEQILVGTLAVDIVDAATSMIVWRGMATKEVDLKASPDKRERNINKAAEKLFKNYPPQSQAK